MLTFDQKLAIIEAFPELERKNVSLGRVNFQFEKSVSDKKNIIYHLHPNGNGFVYAGHLPNYDTDEKGMVNIRDFSEKELSQLIKEAISSLSFSENNIPAEEVVKGEPKEEKWVNDEKNHLLLVNEDDIWNVYFGLNLEDTFGTYEEAEMFLVDQGFRRQ
ncbi:hypothetical protein [Neobacillus sp. PS3-40]|uniref:hypothetical protein n=1 Tax=Neobacillus sp. PS3-40 TaxID=3070679 RepID=UPI0027DF90D8|nr:hypothetical protein [Neobacillus sp. PS3-40]WML44895.1 hypothetical protein RCG20_03020 [Neobacillus sp. PS3-40]